MKKNTKLIFFFLFLLSQVLAGTYFRSCPCEEGSWMDERKKKCIKLLPSTSDYYVQHCIHYMINGYGDPVCTTCASPYYEKDNKCFQSTILNCKTFHHNNYTDVKFKNFITNK